MKRWVRIAAMVPIGTFTNKTDLHPNPAVRTPPAIDPAAKPAERKATRTPTARFLSLPSGNVAARIANAVAIVIAAPTPWIALETISMRSRSEEHTSELQSQFHLVCRLLLEKKKNEIKKE